MKNKTLLKLLWGSSLLGIILFLGVYIFKFNEFEISTNPENWGQFGDYIGGVLNPLFALINLIILSYLSIRLVKEEDKRNKWTLKELARPYGEIAYLREANSVKLIVANIGLGPMIITSIKITDKNGKEYSDFEHLSKEMQGHTDFSFGTSTLYEGQYAISKDSETTLFNLSGKQESEPYKKASKKVRERLNEHKIKIAYSDMYKRKIDTINSQIKFKTD